MVFNGFEDRIEFFYGVIGDWFGEELIFCNESDDGMIVVM